MNTELMISIVMPIALVFFSFVLAFGIVFVVSKKNFDQLAQLSQKFNLKHTVNTRLFGLYKHSSLKGTYKYYPVTVSSYKRGHGKNAKTYTYVEFEIENPDQKSFAIYKEDFFGKITKAFGAKDVEIGNPDFDDKFIISTEDVGFVKDLIKAKFQLDIIALFDKLKAPNLSLKGRALRFTSLGLLLKEEKRETYEDIVPFLHEVAEKIRR